jgi:hypothetical protein
MSKPMSKTKKFLTGLGIWLGVGLVVALALVAHPPTAGAKPSPTTVTTVVDTTLPPPTTTLCNGSYKNCQPYPEPPTTVPPPPEGPTVDPDIVVDPDGPVEALPASTG